MKKPARRRSSAKHTSTRPPAERQLLDRARLTVEMRNHKAGRVDPEVIERIIDSLLEQAVGAR